MPTCGAAFLEDGRWSGEVWNRNKSGEVFAETLTINAVRDAGGNLLQYVALFSDVTQLKEHERQLEHVANYDVLTSLPKSNLVCRSLRQAMVLPNREIGCWRLRILTWTASKASTTVMGTTPATGC